MADSLLLLDLGNSRIKGAIYFGDSLQERFSLVTKANWNESSLALAIQEVTKAEVPTYACICSVVPSLEKPLGMALKSLQVEELFHLNAMSLQALGMTNKTENTGNDRLVSAFGTWLEYRQNLIIIDFGTATTYDVITQDGCFEGGMILPGLELGLKALAKEAEGLMEVDLKENPPLIGRNTKEALNSGIILGNAMMADHFAEKISHQYDRPFRMIATGGSGRSVVSASKAIEGWFEDLTIKAMFRIWKAHRAMVTQGG